MIFKKECNHDWKAIEKSNILQHDDMGYLLRLYIVKCKKCGKTDQRWIDVNDDCLKELETGKSVLCEWTKCEENRR